MPVEETRYGTAECSKTDCQSSTFRVIIRTKMIDGKPQTDEVILECAECEFQTKLTAYLHKLAQN